MATNVFPALNVQPPQQQDLLGQFGKVVALKNMLQQSEYQQQMQPLQLQAEQNQLEQQQLALTLQKRGIESQDAFYKAMQDNPDTSSIDSNGQPNTAGIKKIFDTAVNTYHAHPADLMPIMKNWTDWEKSQADLTGVTLSNTEKANSLVADAVANLKQVAPELKEQMYQQTVAPTLRRAGIDAPATLPSDQQLDAYEHYGMRAKDIYDIAFKNATEGVVPDSVRQRLNANGASFAGLYGLPVADYTLGPGDNWKVADAIDKRMEQTGRAAQNVQQFQQGLVFKNAMLMMRQESIRDREAMMALTPVQGIDAQGNPVMANFGEATQSGLRGVTKMESTDVSKVNAARSWMQDIAIGDPNANPRTNPQQAGINALINDLNAQGKLGPLASRYNDFMAGTWGQGDAEYQALKDKLALSNTLLQNVHVGAKGGWHMLEHFQELANAKKMDAPTLMSGWGTEFDYVRRREMNPGGAVLPGGPAWSAPGGQALAPGLTQPKQPYMPPANAVRPPGANQVFESPKGSGKYYWTDGTKNLGPVQ